MPVNCHPSSPARIIRHAFQVHMRGSSVRLILALGVTISCGDSTDPRDPGSPASLIIVSGNQQDGIVGEELPEALVARVVDSNGTAISGQIVNFVVLEGGGSVFAGAAISDDSGIVRERWTLGTSTADSQILEARAVDNGTGLPIVFGRFIANPIAGPVHTVLMFDGDSQLAESGIALPESLAVELRDQYNNPASGRTVGWIATAGQITQTSTSNANGIAKARWVTGGPPAVISATATVTGLPEVSFFAEVLTTQVQFVAMDIGVNHTCAVTAVGAVYCWGSNAVGQLGQPGPLETCADNNNGNWCSSRALVVPGLTATSVIAAEEHSCALVGMMATCWGSSASGQLGIDSLFHSFVPPTPVSGGHLFQSLTAGGRSTCGITTTHEAYCWGANRDGQLGVSYTGIHPAPVPVSTALLFDTIALGGGFAADAHTCGLVGSDAYCWGQNGYGQLGDSTFGACGQNGGLDCRFTPARVVGGHGFANVSVGSYHTCGLTTTGAAFCWGEGSRMASTPPDICALPCAVSPIAVPGGHIFSTITAGPNYSCGIQSGGELWCWGQLGFGGQTPPTRIAPTLAFQQVSIGVFHACGIDLAGQAWCWGDNYNGQLGDASFIARSTPVRVINR